MRRVAGVPTSSWLDLSVAMGLDRTASPNVRYSRTVMPTNKNSSSSSGSRDSEPHPSKRSKASGAKVRKTMRAAAICAPGFEGVVSKELVGLGCRPKPAGPGTVEFDATARQIYMANVWLRAASRVLVRLTTFRSTTLDHLQRRVADLDWAPWLADGIRPVFRITANDSKLYHTGAISQRLHAALGADPADAEELGSGFSFDSGGPLDGEGEQLFIVRIDRNNVTISVDSSGVPLHQRPWRTQLGSAPLRTTMAAAVLNIVGWGPGQGFLDPFCGVGTIPIEAALMAAGLPPGGDRRFAFHQWPSFEPGTWASVGATIQAANRDQPRAGSPIVASDRDRVVIEAALANAERAGVGGLVEFSPRVVAHLPPLEGPGMVVTNPPYGRRLGDGNLVPLYKRFGAVVRERLPEWDLSVVTPERKLAMAADADLRAAARFRHGGLAVELYTRPAQHGLGQGASSTQSPLGASNTKPSPSVRQRSTRPNRPNTVA